MNAAAFFDDVGRLGGFTTRREAERAASATLATLGATLVEEALRTIAAKTGPSIEEMLRRGLHRQGGVDLDLDEFYVRVSNRERVALGFAVEHAQAVCEALVSQLSESTLTRIRKVFEGSLSPLFLAHRQSARGKPGKQSV
jgi:uncharacterized protein (DUF2267 family)